VHCIVSLANISMECWSRLWHDIDSKRLPRMNIRKDRYLSTNGNCTQRITQLHSKAQEAIERGECWSRLWHDIDRKRRPRKYIGKDRSLSTHAKCADSITQLYVNAREAIERALYSLLCVGVLRSSKTDRMQLKLAE
jgi:hypothetical protein